MSEYENFRIQHMFGLHCVIVFKLHFAKCVCVREGQLIMW